MSLLFACLTLRALTTGALAAAPNVTVDVTLPPQAQQAGLNEAQLEDALANAIGQELHTVDLSEYMNQMANANVLSAKGIGVDYGSDMQRFAVGGGFGTAVNGAGFAFTAGDQLPETGFALQIGVMAGLNLGAFSPPESALRRFRLYVNGMTATTQREPFTATFLNYGGHLQIQVVKGGEKKDGVRWGGLDLTSGYEFSSYSLDLQKSYPISAEGLTWAANGGINLRAAAQSIPMELSTNLHIFVVTAFLGAGADYNLSGDATATINVSGPIDFEYQGQTSEVGYAAAGVSQTGTAAEFTPRVFAGAQVDVFMVKVYGQLNVTLDHSVGGHVGLRVVL
jgi:hypothetical protein